MYPTASKATKGALDPRRGQEHESKKWVNSSYHRSHGRENGATSHHHFVKQRVVEELFVVSPFNTSPVAALRDPYPAALTAALPTEEIPPTDFRGRQTSDSVEIPSNEGANTWFQALQGRMDCIIRRLLFVSMNIENGFQHAGSRLRVQAQGKITDDLRLMGTRSVWSCKKDGDSGLFTAP